MAELSAPASQLSGGGGSAGLADHLRAPGETSRRGRRGRAPPRAQKATAPTRAESAALDGRGDLRRRRGRDRVRICTAARAPGPSRSRGAEAPFTGSGPTARRRRMTPCTRGLRSYRDPLLRSAGRAGRQWAARTTGRRDHPRAAIEPFGGSVVRSMGTPCALRGRGGRQRHRARAGRIGGARTTPTSDGARWRVAQSRVQRW